MPFISAGESTAIGREKRAGPAAGPGGGPAGAVRRPDGQEVGDGEDVVSVLAPEPRPRFPLCGSLGGLLPAGRASRKVPIPVASQWAEWVSSSTFEAPSICWLYRFPRPRAALVFRVVASSILGPGYASVDWLSRAQRKTQRVGICQGRRLPGARTAAAPAPGPGRPPRERKPLSSHTSQACQMRHAINRNQHDEPRVRACPRTSCAPH